MLERRQTVNFRVNMKQRGDMFGEVALMYNVPRSATVAATKDSLVWVLERDIYRCGLIYDQYTETARAACLAYRTMSSAQTRRCQDGMPLSMARQSLQHGVGECHTCVHVEA